MAASYIVQYGRRQESAPIETFGDALLLAASHHNDHPGTVTIINTDLIDVCPDEECSSCNRDGLTAEEREALSDAGLN